MQGRDCFRELTSCVRQVANMSIGLEDTLAYYSPEEFSAGFKKTMAFQPRVIKQNRGSSGEGIWIIKLKDRLETLSHLSGFSYRRALSARTKANIAAATVRGAARTTRSWCSWKPMTTMRSRTPLQSSSNSVAGRLMSSVKRP